MELRIGKEIAHIRESAIKMATLVEEAVRYSIEAFASLDTTKGKEIIMKDRKINEYELLIDKDIFECLALRAPVASDLRFLFSLQKINKDFERIGDHAVNIAQSAINCSTFGKPDSCLDINVMASVTHNMLSDAITCFVNSDHRLALKVLEQDDQVDELNRAMTREVIDAIKSDAASTEAALEILRVSKNLERIADLSTNVAEDVIFHAQAIDVKHHRNDPIH
jgi:phosphate transport system protein